MSSSSASITWIVSLTVLSLAGCVKPEDRFDAFEERVVDAGQLVSCATARERTPGAPLAAIPDVSGAHLLSILVSFAPTKPLQFRCETSFEPLGSGGSLGLSCSPLIVDDDDTEEDERAPIGDLLGQDNVQVDADGGFCATIVGTVPGDANPISGSDIVTAEEGLDLNGTLLDADRFCGTFTGAITQPFSSAISGTFGAVRVEADAEGADLPAPVTACP
jgi:hypothetical protein